MAKGGKERKAGLTKLTISAVMREMGRRGGRKKVPKGAAMLTPEERVKSAQRAANARWAKKRAAEGGERNGRPAKAKI
jgi:hypothetical protein